MQWKDDITFWSRSVTTSRSEDGPKSTAKIERSPCLPYFPKTRPATCCRLKRREQGELLDQAAEEDCVVAKWVTETP